MLVMVAVVATSRPAGAQVEVTPTNAGLPGAGVFQAVLNWGSQIALWACVGAFLAGAGYWGWSHFNGRAQGAHRGQMLTMGGAIGALLVGVAPVAVNTLFNAGVAGA